ncbi:UDP-2,4-diacetamido-2,4,6-trideoxy-beta-L-altropyranose hydrolase [Aliarcobacter cryaerophilus]|uniref:UDP-2,4-diacetamido-2,4, 6-trideoxy-beta-L-altropyranose hydrolase n=1 Tax=Aliarcobacter cryaerophilus TaxID=28198 RepID=UPI0013FE207C|nr:UDP-2,4-diacetamido-2,4,6-trideoxy-beta-L-altropyranose hydrolase [Aliarcobacter cryaerophilus]
MKRILFRCNSSSTIGLGHVKRCLVLAKRLKECNKNLKIFFATQNLFGNINEEILKSGFSIYSIRDNSVEMLDYFVKGLQINLLIIDSYDIDYKFEEELKIKNPVLKIVSFDDMINPHGADIVINHGIQAKEKEYKKILSKDTKLFCGSEYTLLRDEFLETKKTKVIGNSVAIILGGNDILNLSSKIADLLLEINNKYKITIITTSVNPNIDQLNPKLEILIDISNMAQVLSYKELIICSSSGALFEVMSLKKKFINIEVAQNQKVVSDFLEKKRIKTTIKAKNLSLKELEKKIDYINKKDVYKKLDLKFSKYKLVKKILEELK